MIYLNTIKYIPIIFLIFYIDINLNYINTNLEKYLNKKKKIHYIYHVISLIKL